MAHRSDCHELEDLVKAEVRACQRRRSRVFWVELTNGSCALLTCPARNPAGPGVSWREQDICLRCRSFSSMTSRRALTQRWSRRG